MNDLCQNTATFPLNGAQLGLTKNELDKIRIGMGQQYLDEQMSDTFRQFSSLFYFPNVLKNHNYFQRKEYVKYAKVFPLSEMMDFKVPPKWYRRFVGTVEIICGLAMALAPSSKYQPYFFPQQL